MMAPNRFRQEVSDFFIATRFYRIYVDHLAAEGDLVTPYLSQERAVKTHQEFLAFLKNYNLSPDVWYRIRLRGDPPLVGDAVKYFDAKFSEYTRSFSRSQHELEEGVRATRLASLVPFRKHDEQAIFDAAYGPINLEDAAALFKNAGRSPGALAALSVRAVQTGFERFGSGQTVRLPPSTIIQIMEKELPPAFFEKPIQVLDEIRDEIESSARSFTVVADSDILHQGSPPPKLTALYDPEEAALRGSSKEGSPHPASSPTEERMTKSDRPTADDPAKQESSLPETAEAALRRRRDALARNLPPNHRLTDEQLDVVSKTLYDRIVDF